MNCKRCDKLADRCTCLEQALADRRTRDAFVAMADEQSADYADYLRRCGGIGISKIKP